MFRKAQIKDLDKLVHIAESTVQVMKENKLYQWGPEYPKRPHFLRDIENEFGYVLEENNQVMGYLALTEEEPTYQVIDWKHDRGLVVHRLMVDPLARLKGVGQSLIHHSVMEAKHRGFEAVWVDTHPGNLPMQRLLRRMQFKERGFLDSIYRIAYERSTLLNPPKKILVFGNSGVGKTTLSRKLSDKLNIPYLHIDSIYWQKNWQSTPRDIFYAKLKAFIDSHTNFVMDGNYLNSSILNLRLEHADTIIYLDYPIQMALNGIKQREKIYAGRWRTDMAEGCIEKIDQEFLSYVLNFNKTRKPTILSILQKYEPTKNTFIFKSRESLNQFIDSL